jgi:hypothetical protein
MEAEKSILELYEIVLESFKIRRQTLFICFCANRYLKPQENKTFIEHFYSQRPSETQYTEFFEEPLFRRTRSLEASWFEYDNSLSHGENAYSKGFKLRIQFLMAVIKELKKDEKKVGRIKK